MNVSYCVHVFHSSRYVPGCAVTKSKGVSLHRPINYCYYAIDGYFPNSCLLTFKYYNIQKLVRKSLINTENVSNLRKVLATGNLIIFCLSRLLLHFLNSTNSISFVLFQFYEVSEYDQPRL